MQLHKSSVGLPSTANSNLGENHPNAYSGKPTLRVAAKGTYRLSKITTDYYASESYLTVYPWLCISIHQLKQYTYMYM